jgi:hypothetical protein
MVRDGEEAAGQRATPAPETMRLYAGDWAAFVTWCRNAQRSPLPAEPATVAAYLGTLAGRLSHGALSRRVAAIGDQHRQHGFASPATFPVGKTILREARRSATRRRRLPPPAAQLARMAAACPGDLAASVRVTLQHLLNLQRQAVHAAAHVGVPIGQPHPHANRRHDHRRTALMTRRRVARPTSAPTRIQVPSGSAISIRAASTGGAVLLGLGTSYRRPAGSLRAAVRRIHPVRPGEDCLPDLMLAELS